MAAVTAIGVDDDLAACQSGVAHRTADHEAAGGIDVVFHACRVVEPFRHHGPDDFLHDVALDLLVRHVGAVLRRHDDGVDPHRFSVPVFHGHLGFSIGTDPGQDVLFPDFCQSLGEPMCEDDRHRHEFSRLVGGIAEHQSLVAGTAGIHAHGDIARLLVNGGEDGTGVVVESPGGVAVADILDDFANDIRNLDVGLGGDFTGHEGNSGSQNRLAGYPGILVFGYQRVEDSVGDLVGDLVRMSFRHGL